MKAINKINVAVQWVIQGISVVLLSLIAIMLLLQVVLRSFSVGVQWTEEMSRFCYVAMTFLGSVVAITKGRHISITMLLEKLPAKAHNGFDAFIHLVIGAFMAMCTYGVYLTIASVRDVRANSLRWFRLDFLYYVVLIACFLMSVAAIIEMCNILFVKKK